MLDTEALDVGADGVEIGGPEESCRAPMPRFNLECQNIRDGFLFPVPLTGKGFLSASGRRMEREKQKGEGEGRSIAPAGASSCTCTSTVTPTAHAPHLRRHPGPPATLLDMPSLLPPQTHRGTSSPGSLPRPPLSPHLHQPFSTQQPEDLFLQI